MWWQHVAPEPILFTLGAVQLRWYGLLVTLGIVIAYMIARWLYSSVTSKGNTIMDDMVVWVVIAGIIGARLFHVFVFEWSYYQHHLGEIFSIWNGGIAIQGALVGGFVALIFYCRKKNVGVWQLLDCLAPALAFGQAIGRWGNYFNQELYGLPTSGWWGIYINEELRVKNYESFTTFHSTFFYESMLMLATGYLLLVIWARTKNNLNGRVFAFYLVAYGAIRFFMDFIRIDPEIMWLGLKLSQYLSLILIVAGISLISGKQKKTTEVAS